MSPIDQTQVSEETLPMAQRPVGGSWSIETERRHPEDPAEGPDLDRPAGEWADGDGDETPGEADTASGDDENGDADDADEDDADDDLDA